MLCTQCCCCCLQVSLTPPCWWRKESAGLSWWWCRGPQQVADGWLFSWSHLFSTCFPYNLDTKVHHVAWQHWDTILGIRMFSSCFSCRAAGRTPVPGHRSVCHTPDTEHCDLPVPLQTELFFNGLFTFPKAQCPVVSMFVSVCTGRKCCCWLTDLVWVKVPPAAWWAEQGCWL